MEAVRIHPSLRNGRTGRKSLPQKWNRLLFWFSFFMAFPAIVIVQNITIYIFGLIVFFILQYVNRPLIIMSKPLQWVALLFGVGAIVSVLNMPPEGASNSLERALAVLPNYLYWSLLIILMVTHRRLIKLEVVYKAVFWGVMATVFYYIFLKAYLRPLQIFVSMTPNSFAFLMICFTPIAVHYLKGQKGRIWATVFLAFLVLILLRDGRRAGMVLVFLGGVAVLYADRINWKRILWAAILIPMAIALLYTSQVEAFVFQSSERIHEMLYETENIQKEDRSYLTRVAMVKKGLAIFEKYPYTGIGLNNFTNYEANFDKSFEGAAFVVYKRGINETSAHNSYITILGEGGLLLLIPLLLILVYNIMYFLFNFNRLSSCLPIYVGLIAMSVHLYFISAIVNVFAWFLIGLATSAMYKK